MATGHVYVVARKSGVEDALIAHGPDLADDQVQPFVRMLAPFDGADVGVIVSGYDELLAANPDLEPLLVRLKWACETALANRSKAISSSYEDMRVKVVVNEGVDG